MSRLLQPNARWASDQGAADPQLRLRLAAQAEPDGYLRAVAALGGARLLLPVVATSATPAESGDPHSEVAAVSLAHPSGDRALLAFTGLDALHAWNRLARPVPCTVDELAASAAPAGASLLLIDVAGPDPFEIGADVVAHWARGRRLVELDAGGFGWMFAPTHADFVSPGSSA